MSQPTLAERTVRVQQEHPTWTDAQCRMYVELVDAVDDVIPFYAPTMPNVGNKGAPELVDIAGGLNTMRKASDKIEKLVKELIDVKSGATTTRGERYQLNYGDPSPTTRLDQEKAKERLKLIDAYIVGLHKVIEDPEVADTDVITLLEEFLSKVSTNNYGECMVTTNVGRRTFERL